MSGFVTEHRNLKEEFALLNGFLNSEDRAPEEKARIRADMLACARDRQFTFKEYIRYRFDRLTPVEQAAFVSDREHMKYCERLNSVEANDLLDDKYRAYLRFREYYKREATAVKPGDEASRAAFAAFAANVPEMIVKPNDEWGGVSVQAARLADYADADAMLAALLEALPGGFIAEERVANAGVLREVHPASLNTLRISTVKLRGDEVRVIHPRVRFGVGGSVTDNISAGGFQGSVDPETGKVLRVVDALGVETSVHPDTGVAMAGLQLPEWDAALAVTKRLALELDTLHYCGWDLAYTDRGWVMIEGNAYGQFGWQFVEQKGCFEEFEGYVRNVWHYAG